MDPIRREDWRRLPLGRVLVHTLKAPRLVFRGENQALAELLKEDLAEIAEQLEHAGPSFPLRRRKGLMARARRLHIQRVELAVGYAWPGDPRWTEFADDYRAA